MACRPPVPKVTPPYHKRFVSTVGGILSGSFDGVSAVFWVFFDTILPFVTALVIILGIMLVCFVLCMMVAEKLGYEVGIDEQRKKSQKGEGEGQDERKNEKKEGSSDGDSDGSGTGGKEEDSRKGTEVDEKTKLRVNIDMLEGILKAQKERLDELNKN